MRGGERHRLGESALESESGVEETDADWKRAHLIGWEWCGGSRCRLEESALDSWSNVGVGDTDWEKAHWRVEGNE